MSIRKGNWEGYTIVDHVLCAHLVTFPDFGSQTRGVIIVMRLGTGVSSCGERLELEVTVTATGSFDETR